MPMGAFPVAPPPFPPPHHFNPRPPAPFPLSPIIPQPVLVSAAAPVEVGNPSCTLYLQNLPERPNPLKHLPPVLEELFAPFGPLKRKPVVRKGLALKGQAWIIFEKQEDAQAALKALQGTRIWGKSVIIKFARFKSDLVTREEAGEDAVAEEKRRRIQDKSKQHKQCALTNVLVVERAKNPRITKRQQLAQLMSSANPNAAFQNVSIAGPDVLLPNKILFVQNVPAGYPISALKDQFKRFPGLVDVRGVPLRPDLAFVEFETEAQAGAARQIVDRMELTAGQAPVRVSFARK